MRKEYSIRTGTKYTHFIRLRPDAIFFTPFPSVSTLPFISPNGEPWILTGNKRACCCGNEDWFGIGTIDLMDTYFDRIDSILSYKLINPSWTAEDYISYHLKVNGSAALNVDYEHLRVCIHKPLDRRNPGDP
ncbi:unnamed protein product [Didymodactylos carnosus]|nr:unnamed protein product [Didymodactylos carnosus]CAF4451447.1 unnamed protein product [Didymodactylos carnosus]